MHDNLQIGAFTTKYNSLVAWRKGLSLLMYYTAPPCLDSSDLIHLFSPVRHLSVSCAHRIFSTRRHLCNCMRISQVYSGDLCQKDFFMSLMGKTTRHLTAPKLPELDAKTTAKRRISAS